MAAQKNTGSILHLSLHSLSQNSSALRRIPSISSAGPPSWGKQGEEDPPPSSPTLTPVDRTVQSSYCHNPPKQESLLHKSPPPPRAYYQEGSLSHDVTTSKKMRIGESQHTSLHYQRTQKPRKYGRDTQPFSDQGPLQSSQSLTSTGGAGQSPCHSIALEMEPLLQSLGPELLHTK